MMKENLIQVICGPGKGKTASALGRGVTALLKGKTVIMVQFLKGSMETEGMEIVKRLEPEVNYPLSKANGLPASQTSQSTISTGVNSDSPCPISLFFLCYLS